MVFNRLKAYKVVFFMMWFGCSISSIFAQKTHVFRGKTYWVFPQIVWNLDRPNFSAKTDVLNHKLPPILDNHKDGDYAIVYKYDGNQWGERGKQKKIQEKVYATFSIKNNQKNGMAYFYDDSENLIASMCFKNDLLDGDVHLIQTKIWNSDVEMNPENEKYFRTLGLTYYTFLEKSDFKFKEYKYELRYKAGYLVDSVRGFGIYKKDTFLNLRYGAKNGMKNGFFEWIHFDESSKKPVVDMIEKGNYLSSKMHGDWFLYYADGSLDVRGAFFNDSIKLLWNKGNSNVYASFGRDSVLKYLPLAAPQKFFKNPFLHAELEVVYTVNNGGQLQYAFRHDQHISESVGQLIFDYHLKDTIVNGRYYLFDSFKYTHSRLRKRYGVDLFCVDLCENKILDLTDQYDKQLINNKYCEETVWVKRFDVNGELLEHNIYNSKLDFDSISLVLESVFNSKIGKFKDLSFDGRHLRDEVFIQKSSILESVEHQYLNSNNNKFLIRTISLKLKDAHLELIDTLWVNGKWLYDGDAFQDHHMSGLYNSYLYWKFVGFDDYIEDFFGLKPIQHSCVLMNKRPFHGRLDARFIHSKRYRINNVKKLEFVKIGIDTIVLLELYQNSGYRSLQNKVTPAVGSVLTVLNGRIVDLMLSNLNMEKICELHYEQGRLTQKIKLPYYKFQSYKRENLFGKRKCVPEGQRYVLELNFKNGLKEGTWLMNDKHFINFKNNRLHGTQFITNENGQIEWVMNFKNDTLEGPCYKIEGSGQASMLLNFKNGKPDGIQKIYKSSVADTTGALLYVYQFKEGFLDGRSWILGSYSIDFKKEDSLFYSVYSDQGFLFSSLYNSYNTVEYNLKHVPRTMKVGNYEVEKPSPLDRNWNFPFIEEQNVLNFMHMFDEFSDGYYNYIYKDGRPYKEGAIEGFQAVGKWIVYRGSGEFLKYKELYFKDTVLNADSNIHSHSFVKTYYENGQLMYSGFAKDKRSQINCLGGSDLPVFEVDYLEFYDSLGNALLVNDSGYIQELQINGLLLREGRIDNNMKQGLWKYYSSHGLPTEMGYYKNGKREGRWLSGDLANINLNDNMCMMSESEFNEWMLEYSKFLNIKESMYMNGELVSQRLIQLKSK